MFHILYLHCYAFWLTPPVRRCQTGSWMDGKRGESSVMTLVWRFLSDPWKDLYSIIGGFSQDSTRILPTSDDGLLLSLFISTATCHVEQIGEGICTCSSQAYILVLSEHSLLIPNKCRMIDCKSQQNSLFVD